MLKKMMLLAVSAAALVAFSVPAAQANGPVFNTETEEFEGFLHFHREETGTLPTGVFGCEVTISVTGGGNTTAEVTEFTPTTETCKGEGLFTGCQLVTHHANVPFSVHSNTDHSLTVEKEGGNVTMLNAYSGCVFGVPGAHLEFESVSVVPHPTEGPISTLTVHGTTTNGGITATGTLHAETGKALTLTT